MATRASGPSRHGPAAHAGINTAPARNKGFIAPVKKKTVLDTKSTVFVK
ncbi:hypothetical protein HNR55_000532 [Acetobacter lovaniensis]|jgi:hypothetical protein|uniref:Uncharacterized protein n=1 Tax=Acetobacter lovaniensis TaxID=104100 RepID=A0A841QBR5_9PROT|nr:hypothetical protein [Acetobacter lovaniensis]